MVAVVDGALAAFGGRAVFAVCSQNRVVESDGAVIVAVAGEFVGARNHAFDLVGGEGHAGRRWRRRCFMLWLRWWWFFGFCWNWRLLARFGGWFRRRDYRWRGYGESRNPGRSWLWGRCWRGNGSDRGGGRLGFCRCPG